jgi:hypothetical protein
MEPDTVPVSWAAGCVLLLSQVAADTGARRRIPAMTTAARRKGVEHFIQKPRWCTRDIRNTGIPGPDAILEDF